MDGGKIRHHVRQYFKKEQMTNLELNAPESFIAVLKKNALKATPQRIAVHKAMQRLGHASADMVANEIENDGNTKITVASVYNILSEFAKLGIYRHRLSANNKMFFDLNTFEHAHFYDIENNTFRDISEDKVISELLEKLSKKRFKGYKVDYIDIQIVGHPTKKR